MPLSYNLILALVVAMFAAFIGVVGVVSTWVSLSQAKEEAEARRKERVSARAA